jgi:small subunit ribosomal protein S21
VIAIVIQVKVRKGESADRALRRLKKILDKEGMMKQIRANRYFEKPSEKKRRKQARARARVASNRM